MTVDAALVLYNLSGRITDTNGAGLAGVSVNLSGDQSAAAVADADGVYRFTGLSNGDYVVTPSHAEHQFSSRSAILNGGDVQVLAIIAMPLLYTISGRVVTGEDTGLADVVMNLNGSQNGRATTDAQGRYELAGIPSGQYTVAVEKSGYSFLPPQAKLVVAASIPGIDFKAEDVRPRVSIIAPSDGRDAELGESLRFEGQASASDGSSIDHADWRWFSSLDGAIEGGQGEAVFDSDGLSAGTHTIRLVVQDAVGVQGFKLITLTVRPGLQDQDSSDGEEVPAPVAEDAAAEEPLWQKTLQQRSPLWQKTLQHRTRLCLSRPTRLP